MNRQLSTVFILILLSTLSLWAQTGHNILLNPDFENGLDNWTNRKCTLTVVSDPVFSGSQALLVSDRTKAYGGPAQTITDSLLRHGQGKYIVSGYYRTQSGEDSAKIAVRLTVDGIKKTQTIFGPIGPDNWAHIQDTLMLTWDGEVDEASFFLQTKNDQSLSYFVDNVSLIPDSVWGGIDPGDTTTPPTLDDPISPQDYVQMLKPGFDVNWTKNASQAALYSEELLLKIKAKGFNHIRLRTNLESAEEYINLSDNIVRDCLKHDVIPILAFGGQAMEENPDSTNIANFVQWWRTVAEHYQNYSHKVAFNLLIEISGELKYLPDTLNSIYEKTVSAIRETNPTRLIIIAPRMLSNPFYLHELKIPSQANGYLFWEWHFYASGPSKTNEDKLWTTGTPEERKLITDKIDSALAWESRTGLPSWVGAWMPGNYNKANEYTVPEQVVFASFMVRELEKAKVPWAVNALQHFNSYVDGPIEWYDFRMPVLDILLDPWKVSLYSGEGYSGDSLRLAPGEYDKPFLENAGFLNNIKSLMVPLDYVVTTYSDSGFTGVENIYTGTDSTIVDAGPIMSLKVRYDTTQTAIDDNSSANENIKEYRLFANYPNPFNPKTVISYQLSVISQVDLSVYNLLGQKVKTLVSEKQPAGKYKVNFNATGLASGVYIYRLKAGNFVQSKKMILLR